MNYGRVPHLNRDISRVVLGSVPFSTSKLENTFELLDAYHAAGGNTIDLSHIYGSGDSHRALAAYFKERGNRDEFILFDKGCHHYGVRRVRKEFIASDIADNHRNLGENHTEFFVLHRDDQLVPIEDIVNALNEQKARGNIDVFGGSNFHHSRIRNGNHYAEKNGLQGFSASSPNFSLASPNEPMWEDCYSVDRVARDWYEETQFPLFSWSSAGGGFFAKVDSPDVRRVYHNHHNFERLKRAEEFAEKYNVTASVIAMAWILSQPMNIFGLIGPANASQMNDYIPAFGLKLDTDELRYLELGT